jgi:hypothetical protein
LQSQLDWFSFKIYKGMIPEAIFIHINLKYAKKNKFRENDAKKREVET